MPEQKENSTIAVLSQQIQTLTQEVQALRQDVRSLNNGVTDYRVIQSRHDTQIQNLGDDIDGLSMRVNGWSVLNSAGVVIATILSMTIGRK